MPAEQLLLPFQPPGIPCPPPDQRPEARRKEAMLHNYHGPKPARQKFRYLKRPRT